MTFDSDALLAGVDLVGRSGATECEIGWLHDDVPTEEAAWWARARYGGTQLVVEDKPGPVEAVEALARRILDGGMCNHCRKPVRLADTGQ